MVSKIEKIKDCEDLANYLKLGLYLEKDFFMNFIDCLEINKNLQKILNEKKYTLGYNERNFSKVSYKQMRSKVSQVDNCMMELQVFL